MMISKKEILKSLREGICNVRFTKVDGSSRILRCTLHPDYVPGGSERKEKSNNTKRHYVSDNVLAVWDLDELHWKSFRINSVEKVDVLQSLVENVGR